VEILITTPSFGQQSRAPWQALEDHGFSVRRSVKPHPLSAADLAEEIGNADALIVGLDAVDASVFAAAPNLRVVAKHGVGVDNIDCAAAAAAGVRVVNAPGSNSGAVADLTFGLMLALARQIIPAHLSTQAGGWNRFTGVELTGRTLGLVGFGRIGQAVARRARAFDMKVVAYDPYLPAEVFPSLDTVQTSLENCIASADFLSLHMPGTPGDPPLLDAAALSTMKQGAFLINAARGGLVDEDALAERLHAGQLGGAALDAFSVEPLLQGSAIRTAPNVILTPHIGAFTDQANATMGVMVVEDVARVLRNEEPANSVA
jgi:D-3-phosphoglycerate dehydrogenase